jgi:alkylated DNA repair dioxygenase AlkB
MLSLQQTDLFAAERTMPPGFAYRAELIAESEEGALVERFADLPFQPFEFHGYLGKRRIVSFGWRYDYAGRALRQSEEIPSFFFPLREKAAAFAGVDPAGLQQILVTEYAPGAGIGWHRDKPMFEDVIGISFLSPGVLRFRRKAGSGWDRLSRIVEPRSAYLLRGPARREWEHSLPVVDALRYSVTFRNFTADERQARSLIATSPASAPRRRSGAA